MNDYTRSVEWDFKLMGSVKHVRKFKCCPNVTYPKIDFMFSLSRHYGIIHISRVLPIIGKRLPRGSSRTNLQLNLKLKLAARFQL